MKKERQRAIIQLISELPIETQEELTMWLNQRGFKATQATVSRDIRELELMKFPTTDGKQIYGLVKENKKESSDKYQRILKDAIISLEVAGNMLVIKTVAGMAMACAAALDAVKIVGMVGSIAGDDTIMCVLKSESVGADVVSNINRLLE